MITPQEIKAKARTLGFDLCGISPVDAFPELSFLKEWLDRGYAGEMAWMARSAERRADVRNVVPEARSVIVLGTVYNSRFSTSNFQASNSQDESKLHDPGAKLQGEGTEARRQEGTIAKISRYAWGDDYHDVLKQRLAALVDWMHEQHPEPFEARYYVDTGPVQERVYAQYAGLGWIGKNTCLINPELGSYLFLSEIICSLPLEPDAQGLEQCGSCTKCLEACPTGALVESGVLDATRCLSYLTIELRGAIPEAVRPAMSNHVYGCDICQEVCPYNQVPPVSADAPWQPRPGLAAPRLADLWRRSDTDLRALIRKGPMTRPKLTGLRRNLAVAIGNSGDADAMAALAEPNDDRPSADDPIVREHVRWARKLH